MFADLPPAHLMVIGDSLAQGCRSLTVKREYCAQSCGAWMARAQGWPFVTPDFPIPVLFDLEDEIRRLDPFVNLRDLRFEGFLHRFHDNLQAWLDDGPTSQFPCFDNLALSGCLVDDLYNRTARSSNDEIARLAPDGAAAYIRSRAGYSTVGNLHLAINARFTLNPSRDPSLNDLTPLDWVRRRRPTILMVQVGHNHGLYRVGCDAEVNGSPADCFTSSGGDDRHAPYYQQWRELGRQLAALPSDVETIVVMLLPKVGAVAGLRPRSVEREEGYAESYEPVFSFSEKRLPGETLRRIDEAIRDGNNQIRAILNEEAAAAGVAGRLKFVDTYALLDARDYKNHLDPTSRVVVTPDQTIDNRYIEGRPTLHHGIAIALVAGGIQSIDGMHATACGYADLASEIMKVMELPHHRPGLLAHALKEDPLLSDYPVTLNIVTRVLSILRDLQHLGRLEAAPRTALAEEIDIRGAIDLMKAVFTRH